MISVNFTNGVDKVTATQSIFQWDINRTLKISGLNVTNIPEIHFTNKVSKVAIAVDVSMANGVINAYIPNSILRQGYDIIAYVYVSEGTTHKTIKTVIIPLNARSKPSDYVDTPDNDIVVDVDEEVLNTLLDEQSLLVNANNNASDDIIDILINGYVDGSPKGVYDTLTALQTAFPNGTTGVYLTADNGHWYYYNNGWLDGGVYKSDFTGEELTTEVNNINTKINSFYSNNRFNIDDISYSNIINASYGLDNGGNLISIDGVGSANSVSGYIPVNEGVTYIFKVLRAELDYFITLTPSKVCLYDKNKKYVSTFNSGLSKFTIPSNAGYMRIQHTTPVFESERKLMCVSEEYNTLIGNGIDGYTPFIQYNFTNGYTLYNVDVKMFGAVGDGVANDTLSIQNAIDYAYNNSFSTVYIPAGTYKVTKPIYLYEKISLIGDSQYTSIIKKTTNTADMYGKNSIICLVNYEATSDDVTDSGYQQIKRLCITGNVEDYAVGKAELNKISGIYAKVNTPYVIIEEIETNNVDIAIDLKGAWISRFKKLKIRGHYRGLSISSECQGVVIEGANIMQSHEYGLYINGSHYNHIASVFVEWAYGGTAFYFGFGTYTVNGIGVEITENLSRMIVCDNSRVVINEGLVPLGNSEDYTAFRLVNSTMKITMADLGFTNVNKPTNNGMLYSLGANSKLIMEYCNTLNEYPVASVVDETSTVTII